MSQKLVMASVRIADDPPRVTAPICHEPISVTRCSVNHRQPSGAQGTTRTHLSGARTTLSRFQWNFWTTHIVFR